ncbi:MAG: antibiotic biosynthesis monooxygenase family protein [Blastocatellia bacterium]
MFIVVYRWKLKEGMEDRFRQGWRAATEAISQRYGSLGSRLHKADDGAWVAYAQWPDKERWEAMRGGSPADVPGFDLMRESIDGSTKTASPLFCMTVTDDYLKPAAEQAD